MLDQPAASGAPRAIAILGGGFAGTIVAVHLLRDAPAPLEISLIERRPVLGEGVAYSTTLGTHVLNVPADRMGAFAEGIGDFQRWLKALEPEFGEFAPHGFVPRIWYGTYLRSILAEAERSAPDGVRLSRFVDTVESIEEDPEGLTIGLASGDRLRADRLVLAFGNLPAGDPPLGVGTLGEHPGYVPDPWDTEAVRAIPADADVLLIGTGLTMVDWAFSLGRQGHRGTIHAVSRRGLVPRAHGPAAPLSPGPWLDAAPATALGLSRAIRREIARTTEAGGDWRSVVDALRPRTAGLWASLPVAQRRRFLRHLRPFWDVHRHRAAPHVAALIEEMQRNGRLVVHAGRLVSVEDRPGRAGGPAGTMDVTIRERRTGAELILGVERIVNAIGPGGDIRTSGEAFLDGLLRAGIGQADPLGLGLRTTSDGALIAADGSVSTRIFTLGSSRRGDLWESTAVPELRVQAALLARRLVLHSAPHGIDREE
jgi:uncharacterized NAD(P)/FAD-binding protein YdhS